jgi:hypothetical protein
MSRRMIPPLRGRIDDCTDPTVMKQIRINQLDVGEESIDELLERVTECVSAPRRLAGDELVRG